MRLGRGVSHRRCSRVVRNLPAVLRHGRARRPETALRNRRARAGPGAPAGRDPLLAFRQGSGGLRASGGPVALAVKRFGDDDWKAVRQEFLASVHDTSSPTAAIVFPASLSRSAECVHPTEFDFGVLIDGFFDDCSIIGVASSYPALNGHSRCRRCRAAASHSAPLPEASSRTTRPGPGVLPSPQPAAVCRNPQPADLGRVTAHRGSNGSPIHRRARRASINLLISNPRYRRGPRMSFPPRP